MCVIVCLESITRFIGKQNEKGMFFSRHRTIKMDTLFLKYEKVMTVI